MVVVGRETERIGTLITCSHLVHHKHPIIHIDVGFCFLMVCDRLVPESAHAVCAPSPYTTRLNPSREGAKLLRVYVLFRVYVL